jgi:2-amino-4-hydroxy-6-hydroxymethyldihydropteridine diphosphokinase
VFLGLGSNLGDRFRYIQQAAWHLEEMDIKLLAISSLYETEPVEVFDQPEFINLTCEIETDLAPKDLLDTSLLIERRMGRIRRKPKGPRIIDIDLLFYGQKAIHSKHLSVPHPAISQRRFVLVPMVEIAPEFKDPLSGLTMKQLLDQCPDEASVRLLQPFSSTPRGRTVRSETGS